LENAFDLVMLALLVIELIPTKTKAERTPITTITINISIKVNDLFIV